MVLRTYNPSSREAKERGSGAQNYPQLHSEFEASLGSMRPISENDSNNSFKEAFCQASSPPLSKKMDMHGGEHRSKDQTGVVVSHKPS